MDEMSNRGDGVVAPAVYAAGDLGGKTTTPELRAVI